MGQFLATATAPAALRMGAAAKGLGVEGVAVLAAGRIGDGSLTPVTELYGFATVKTDKDDYAPGEFVTITGKGWQPGETVNLILREVGTGAMDTPLNAIAQPDGTIRNDFWAPNESHLGVRFYLTAVGAGSQAQTTFTDGNRVRFSLTASGAETNNFGTIVPNQCFPAFVQEHQGSRGIDNGPSSSASGSPHLSSGWCHLLLRCGVHDGRSVRHNTGEHARNRFLFQIHDFRYG